MLSGTQDPVAAGSESWSRRRSQISAECQWQAHAWAYVDAPSLTESRWQVATHLTRNHDAVRIGLRTGQQAP